MDVRQGLAFIACLNSGANDYARLFAQSLRTSLALLIAASQRLCLAESAYPIALGKRTICAAEPSASCKAASRWCAEAIANFCDPNAGTSSTVAKGCRKSDLHYSASPYENLLLHDDRTYAAPPFGARGHPGVLKCPIR